MARTSDSIVSRLKNTFGGGSSKREELASTTAAMKKKRAAANMAQESKKKNVRQPNLYPPKLDSFAPKAKAKSPTAAVRPPIRRPAPNDATTKARPTPGAGAVADLGAANMALNKRNAAKPAAAKSAAKNVRQPNLYPPKLDSFAPKAKAKVKAKPITSKKTKSETAAGAAAVVAKTKSKAKPAEKKAAPKTEFTGKGGRNIASSKKANVTKEQLTKTDLTLRDYLNFMDKNNRRPTKADAPAARKLTAAFKAKKAKNPVASKSKMVGDKKGKKFDMNRPNQGGPGLGGIRTEAPRAIKAKAGGMMKSKGMAKGGAMKTKGMSKGGAMKTKGMSRGGAMKDLTGDGQITQKDILKGRGVPGFKGGGMKTKGSAAGGMKAGGMKTKGFKAGGMKTKGYKVGGMRTKGSSAGGVGKRNKVRGAGIARKGVRPAKMR